MCGRFSDTIPTNEIAKIFSIDINRIPKREPRRNISPQSAVLTIRDEHTRIADYMLWGLIPTWAKDPTLGRNMFNARAETVHEKPSFQIPFKNCRCLIVANGFYESE